MSIRVLTGAVVLSFMLLAIWLFGSAVARPTSERQLGSDPRLTGGIWEPTTVYARRIITPEIASRLQLLQDGRRVEVVGHVTCGEGQRFSVEVTVTQDSTGAVATGHTQGTCTGERKQTWTAIATVKGGATFEEGTALVCAEASWPSIGTVEWCDRVRLQE